MKISIIGCGKMGSKMAERLANAHHLVLFDRNQERTEKLAERIGAKTAPSATEAVLQAEIVVLAVKPFNFDEIAQDIENELNQEQLLVSVMGGITLCSLEQRFTKAAVVRMMPNIPVQYGQGVVGVVETEKLTGGFKKMVVQAFSNLGSLIWIPESKIDAISALTGSGPAFIFVMIESIIDAGIAMGIPAEKARELAIQLISGSITMLQETGMHPGELKWEVTSPGGTTIAGIKTMEDLGVRSGIINTFLATYERSKELSE